METHIQKWGNSHAVRIPASLLKDLNLTNGSAVEIVMQDNHLVIYKKDVAPKLEDILEKINPNNLHHLELEDSADQPRGKEVW